MTLTEIHMIAEIFGSLFLVISAAIIIFELHQNLKQRKIQNTFMRTIEADKIYYKTMERDFAILLCKGKTSYSELVDYEKCQFDAYVSLILSVFNRADIMADETSYVLGKQHLKNRIKKLTQIQISEAGFLSSYLSLKERGSLDGYDNFHRIVDELQKFQKN